MKHDPRPGEVAAGDNDLLCAVHRECAQQGLLHGDAGDLKYSAAKIFRKTTVAVTTLISSTILLSTVAWSVLKKMQGFDFTKFKEELGKAWFRSGPLLSKC